MKHRYLTIIALLAVCPTLLAQTPVIEAVVNSALPFEGSELSPGTRALLQGRNLSSFGGGCTSFDIPWPTSLPNCGLTLLINGDPVPLHFVFGDAIEFQIPFVIPASKGISPSSVEFVVDVAGSRSQPFMVELKRFSPAIFQGQFDRRIGQGTVERITLNNRALPGDTIIAVATGLGPSNPPVPAGFSGNGEALVTHPRVRIHAEFTTLEAEVLSAYAVEVGAVQVEFVLPEALPMQFDAGFLHRVELLIEDQGEVFTSSQVELPVEAEVTSPDLPAVALVFNTASFGAGLARGMPAQMAGRHLSAAPDPNQFCNPSNSDPLPTIIPPCNAMVLVDGEPAPILFSWGMNIGFQIPFDEPAGKGSAPSPVEIVVDIAGVRTPPYVLELQRFAPTIVRNFIDTEMGELAVGRFQRGDPLQQVAPDNPALPGEMITAQAIGLGQTDPPVPTGFSGNGEALIAELKILIHGAAKAVREAEVISARANIAAGGINVEFILPSDLPLPIDPFSLYDVELVIEDGGEVFTSPPAKLAVAAAGGHQITGVLDAAGGQALISPGSTVSVFGDFAGITTSAGSIPLTENLNGFSVTFNGLPGALFGLFDGPFDQANVQVPWNVDVSSGKVEVKVHLADDTTSVSSDPFEVDAAAASPGIYMFPPGTTQAIVTNFKQAGDDVTPGSWAQASGSVDPATGQPAAIGGVATIWGHGLGAVSPLPATGDVPQPPGTVPVVDKIVRVFVGDVEAQVLGAVLQPTSVGLNQINIVIPDGVTPGDAIPIVIEVECPDGTNLRSREDATIAVRAAP